MKLYRIKKAGRISYLTMSMKYKIEKLCNGEYWELKEFRDNKYVVLRYFKYFPSVKFEIPKSPNISHLEILIILSLLKLIK